MKRVIWSTFDDYTSEGRGGTAIAVHEVAKRLAEIYQVTILAAKRKGSCDQVLDGVEYKHIGVTFGDIRFRQLVYLSLLPWEVLFRKYDVWIEAFTGPISTAFLPLFTRRPVIGVTHFFNGDEMRKKYKLPFDWIERLGIKTFNCLVALTEFQKNKAVGMNPGLDIRVIPNGVDSQVFSLARSVEGSRNLLYFGRIDIHTKGLDILLESIAKVTEISDDIDLVIGGKGTHSDEERFVKMAESFDLSKRVFLKGYVSGDEKYDLLKSSLIFLAPSRFENFGGAILEAMASGCPVVIFDLPCHSWIPSDCVVRVAPFDVDGYACAVRHLIDYPEEREAMGRKARSFVRAFSWDNTAKKYEEFIEDVTNRNA